MQELPLQHFYTVRPGDTLYNIARRWALPIETVIAANNVTIPDMLFPGQQLSIPPGVTSYRVDTGETIYQISQFYGVPMSVIIKANSLQAPYFIYPGQLLSIPAGVPYYTVQPGDTLFQIARRFNVVTAGHSRPELIRQVNQLPSVEIIPGMRIMIPFAPPGTDGLIAYTSDKSGIFDIWLYSLSNGKHVQLTRRLGASFSEPIWAPDSTRIAFTGENRFIYVLYLESGKAALIDQFEVETLFTLHWSPNSQMLAYTKHDYIVLYNVISHQAQSIPEPGASDVQWFPSGEEILFQAPDESGISQLFRMKTDGTSKQQITQNQDFPLHNVRLSPDGRFALYTSPGVSISIIYSIDLTSGELFEVRGGPLAKNYYPEWSPDAARIGYSATAFSEKGNFSLIRTAGKRGENDRTWAISDCFATPVTWSYDSKKIAYLSGCKAEQLFAGEMWYLDLSHPVPIALTAGIRITSFQWSPQPISLPRKTYYNETYNVSFEYPLNWHKVTPERYEGEDGFFQIAAISAGPDIKEVCRNEAFHSLMPYGSRPQIIKTEKHSQEACFIFPSSDQPLELEEQAAFIVRYPSPVYIQGEQYNYFILWASKDEIHELVSTLAFINT
ncbi:LysM peptidoglycan-binding domain-containing protein [Alteribacillus sp. YIM 98480]|uniref:LysM peptidoglycan-binding domain-containing protein n=1 Tax=Alteribacillus sp. YIM 98480 TaxID=2606599 RepID=UPI00131D7E3E|nr:LysM peptidoglycan-binding domain-containing protein [Alteribacillus sp. YIM 98480]